MAADRDAQQGTPQPKSATLTVVLALLAGFGLRVWFVLGHRYLSSDSLLYGDLARNLLQHSVYGISESLNGVPIAPHLTLIRLPGYPLFLALCFRIFGVERYGYVLFVQLVVDLFTCALVAALARRIFGRRTGLIALWLAALCPFTANYVAAPLTETLTLFCIALVFFSLERWAAEAKRERTAGLSPEKTSGFNRWLAPLAFGLSYAILLRPEQGLLAAAVLPSMLWISMRRMGSVPRWQCCLPVLLTASLTVLPLVPWAARNWQIFHVFQPLAPRFATDPGETNPSGFQRWYRTWAIDFTSTDNVYWNYDGSPIRIEDLPTRAFDSSEQYLQTKTVLAHYNETQQDSDRLNEEFDALAATRIRAHPMRYFVALPLARLFNMMLRPRTEMLPVEPQWWKYDEGWGSLAFALFYSGFNLAYFALAALAWTRRRVWYAHRALVWALLWTLALRSALLLTLDNSEPRYTLEFFPVLIVFAAATLAGAKPEANP